MRARFATIAALLLAGCTVGPDWHEPRVATPSTWGGEPARSGIVRGGTVDPQWWRSFGDAELDRLVDRLARENLPLQEAAERIEQGRAAVQEAASEGLPHIDYNPHYSQNRQSPNGFVSLLTPAPGAPLSYQLFDNGLQSSWELDLFGRVRRSVEAQRANTAAAVEARNEVALTTVSDLATDYMRLRGVQAREAITRRNLALIRHSADLVHQQRANGVATNLDVAQADAEVATVAATLPGLAATEAALVNAIGLLLAAPPRALAGELAGDGAALPVPPLAVPVGLPGDLVRRRPDVRRAEDALHAATAQTGVAIADFYPDVTLAASATLEGRQLANAFSLPSRTYMIGPTIDLPIFEGGRLRGQLRLRRSQQREAALAFRETVLQAWNDADNAMTAYAAARDARGETALALGNDRTAVSAASQQFSAGSVDFLNVITSENAALQAEDALAVSDTEIDADLVALYRALGGGWEDGSARGAAP